MKEPTYTQYETLIRESPEMLKNEFRYPVFKEWTHNTIEAEYPVDEEVNTIEEKKPEITGW